MSLRLNTSVSLRLLRCLQLKQLFPFLERRNLLLHLFHVHDDIWTTSTFTRAFSENQQVPNLKERVVLYKTLFLLIYGLWNWIVFFLWLKNSLELKVNHIKSCARLKPNKLDCQLTRLSLATFFFAEMLTSQFGKQTPAERVDLWWEGGSKSSFILNVSQKLLDYIWDVCSVFSPKQPKTCWDRTNLIEFENSILFSGSAPYQEATAMMGNVLCCVFTVKS